MNAGKRDQNDSWLNRVTLKIQYSLSDHIFVHTDRMKNEMISEFSIPEEKISVIPFGINNTVPNTNLSSLAAKRQLGISGGDRTLLFFGNIAPYKGLEYLIAAFGELLKKDRRYRLLIVGKPKGSEAIGIRFDAALQAAALGTVSFRRSNISRTKKLNCISKRRMFWFSPTPASFRAACFSWATVLDCLLSLPM